MLGVGHGLDWLRRWLEHDVFHVYVIDEKTLRTVFIKIPLVDMFLTRTREHPPHSFGTALELTTLLRDFSSNAYVADIRR